MKNICFVVLFFSFCNQSILSVAKMKRDPFTFSSKNAPQVVLEKTKQHNEKQKKGWHIVSVNNDGTMVLQNADGEIRAFKVK